MKMKIRKTSRGFNYIEFEDNYGVNCTLQKSSLASEDCVWFGVSEAEPKVLASEAKSIGIETNEKTGWVRCSIPEEIFVNTRMHLSKAQVKELLPYLIKFAATGDI